MKATAKDLRLHTNAVLAAVDRGETVIITHRGKCRAVLERWPRDDREKPSREKPSREKPSREKRNPVFGIWTDRDDDVAEQVRGLRRPRYQH